MKNFLALAVVLTPLCFSFAPSTTPADPPLRGQEGEADQEATSDRALPRMARFQDGTVKEGYTGTTGYRTIQAGVSWLIDHQAPDGSWSLEGGAGTASVGASSLALLALFGDGNTTQYGEHREAASRGVAWLVSQQDGETGRIGKGPLQEHAIATLALCELRHHDSLAVTDHEAFPAAHEAARYLLAADVWTKRDNPVELAWCIAAAVEAKGAGAEVDQEKLDAVREWIHSTVEKTGKVSIGGTPDVKERGTAALLLPRVLLGEDPKKGRYIERQSKRLVRSAARPAWEQGDLEYWYWATNGLERCGGESWKEWKPAMTEILLENRRQGGGGQGSWSAVGSDPARGAVRSTAMAVLVLETPYRFAPMKQELTIPKGAFNDVIGIGGGAGGKFGGRFGGRRNLRITGGSGTEKALKLALEWLVANQSPDGSWSASDSQHTVGTTGLALLALMGDGHTTRQGLYNKQVTNGVKWLRSRQDQETGYIGRPAKHPTDKTGNEPAIYEHAIATLALCEAYYFSKSPLIRATAQRAVDYALSGRNPDAVWGYTVPPNGRNDTSITSWMVFVVKSAEEAGLTIDPQAFDDALAWLDAVTDEKTGRVGYDEKTRRSPRIPGRNDRFPPERGEAMTAAGLLCRFFLGQTPKTHPVMEKHADLLFRCLPEWDEEGLGCDMYYWYYGSYAMYQMGGKHWKAWNKAMKKAVLESQCSSGENQGSWDPIGPWGMFGGRVYSTAMMALTLEVYFRYSKIPPK